MMARGDTGIREVKVNGRKVWQARVAVHGLRKSRLCASFAAARTAKAELVKELQQQAARADQVDMAPATLALCFPRYAEDLEARGKSEETIARAVQTGAVLGALLPDLLAKPLSKITEADIFAFRRARMERPCFVSRPKDPNQTPARPPAPAKESTVNRDMRTLRAMLKRARPDFHFPAGAFFPEDDTRVRWLRPEEELLVFEPMAEPFQTIARLAALTLMRLSEILRLRREMVHLEQGVVLLPRAKGGARPVILSGDAQKLLRAQLEGSTGEWVFPNPDGRPYTRHLVSKKWRRAAQGAGLTDFHFHDLRHDGATRALNEGVSEPILMQLGGWKSGKMMRRYAAVTDASLRRAAELVAGNKAWTPEAGPIANREGQRRRNPVILGDGA
jgi:integrase